MKERRKSNQLNNPGCIRMYATAHAFVRMAGGSTPRRGHFYKICLILSGFPLLMNVFPNVSA